MWKEELQEEDEDGVWRTVFARWVSAVLFCVQGIERDLGGERRGQVPPHWSLKAWHLRWHMWAGSLGQGSSNVSETICSLSLLERMWRQRGQQSPYLFVNGVSLFHFPKVPHQFLQHSLGYTPLIPNFYLIARRKKRIKNIEHDSKTKQINNQPTLKKSTLKVTTVKRLVWFNSTCPLCAQVNS